jgi:hypothetical protein
MTSAIANAPGAIIDNYVDAIIGGNSARGSGTLYLGIPGRMSNDPALMGGEDTPLAVAGNTTLSTTTFDVANSRSWTTLRWVKDGPGYWAHCLTSGANFDQARKIIGWNNQTKVFTVANGFSAIPSKDDSFEILQGFAHPPYGIDLEADYKTVTHGFDRFFSPEISVGKQIGYYGAGVATYQAELKIKLRIMKYAKSHRAEQSMFENLAIIRSAITSASIPDHRDGTYTRALLPTDGAVEILINDSEKIVAVDKYTIFYRLQTGLR